jgi:hypothetical protein
MYLLHSSKSEDVGTPMRTFRKRERSTGAAILLSSLARISEAYALPDGGGEEHRKGITDAPHRYAATIWGT